MDAGLGSFAFTWSVGVHDARPASPLGAHELVDEAAALGMEVLQLADNVPVRRLGEDGLRDLKERAAAAGVRLELGARGLTAAALERDVGVARALGAHLVRYVIDAAGLEPPADAVARLLRGRLDLLADAQVTIALENHDRFTAAQLAGIVEHVGSPHVGVCLDTVNSIGAGEGLAQVLAVLAPLTVNLHVKDFTISRRRHGMGFVVEGARLGDGMLDLPAVLDAVERHGRCETAVFEQWAPECPTLTETVALERAWAQHGTAVLRRALAERHPALAEEGAHRTP